MRTDEWRASSPAQSDRVRPKTVPFSSAVDLRQSGKRPYRFACYPSEKLRLLSPSKLLFLPGASGSTAFWQPLANHLTTDVQKVILGYPGFGQEPAASDVNEFDDLVRMVVSRIDQPTALIAQSMGGVIAIRAALEKPDLVTHLVLTVTSGGLNTRELGAQNWQDAFVNANPTFPTWFVSFNSDLTREIGKISQPTLLLWGDADPISPVAVGQRLLELLPHARLHVTHGGNHNLACDHAIQLAPLVDAHLSCNGLRD
jgi:pimeloyl-ACP methyl ester carboxylesterase